VTAGPGGRGRKPVANQALWKMLDAEVQRCRDAGVAVEWTRAAGHAGDAGNEAADRLARAAAEGATSPDGASQEPPRKKRKRARETK